MTPAQNPPGSWFGNLSIRGKVLAPYGVLILLVSLVILVFIAMLTQYTGTTDLVRDALRIDERADRLNSLLRQGEASYRYYLLTGDEQYLQQFNEDHAQFREQIAQYSAESPASLADDWREVERLAGERGERYLIPGIGLRQRYDDGMAGYDELVEHVVAGMDAGGIAGLNAALEAIEITAHARVEQRMTDVSATLGQLRWLLALGGLGIIAVGIFLARISVREIGAPIVQIDAAAQAIADGDLDRRIGWQREDELGRLAASFDLMTARLQRLVSDQQTALQEIQEQEGVLNGILNSVTIGLAMVDSNGNVALINRAIAEMAGRPYDELNALSAPELQHLLQRLFADPESTTSLVSGPGFESDQIRTLVLEMLKPEHRLLDVHTTPVYSRNGDRLGRIYAARDVTRERELDQLKTEFVSMVSHELRTPMTSIKGYVDLLREGEVGELSAEQQAFLDIVATSTDRLVALINDLLDISRIEAGRIELKRERVDLAASVRAVVDNFRPQITARDQRLTVELPPDPLPIIGDADRITQILTNLLSNANKYTPRGGEITISAEAGDGEVEIAVTDTGIGLTQAEQAQIFDRFYRAPNRLSQEAGGTGLGLTITRSLVEMHGGTIAVQSRPGQGSTFGLTLPILPA